jgi:hypothetical protein
VQTPGVGWLRLRRSGTVPLLGFNAQTGVLEPVSGEVTSITIVFDEVRTSVRTTSEPPSSTTSS